MLVWIILVSLVLGFFVIHPLEKFRIKSAHKSKNSWIELGSDEEILYCPGDEKGDGHDEY